MGDGRRVAWVVGAGVGEEEVGSAVKSKSYLNAPGLSFLLARGCIYLPGNKGLDQKNGEDLDISKYPWLYDGPRAV